MEQDAEFEDSNSQHLCTGRGALTRILPERLFGRRLPIGLGGGRHSRDGLFATIRRLGARAIISRLDTDLLRLNPTLCEIRFAETESTEFPHEREEEGSETQGKLVSAVSFAMTHWIWVGCPSIGYTATVRYSVAFTDTVYGGFEKVDQRG